MLFKLALVGRPLLVVPVVGGGVIGVVLMLWSPSRENA
jgi:hypothetical protein